MSRLFRKLFGAGAVKTTALARARRSELRGDLAQAVARFAEAGRPDEAARVMVLRGDAEADPAARLRHYAQAAATAPEASAASALARKKRALLVLAIAADAPMTSAVRQDLLAAADDLEALGEYERAAEAYARAGDLEGQARTLARAGDVEALEAVLEAQQRIDRQLREGRHALEEMRALETSGRRREALWLARASTDEGLREQGRALEGRRITGSVVHVSLRGRRFALALGQRILVGRAPEAEGRDPASGALLVPSPALSRRHVVVERRGDDLVVRDLGSRNGTTLRGLGLTGEAVVGDGLELRLAHDVPLIVRPAGDLPGSAIIEVAGARYVAPLGPARLDVGQWRLERGEEDWVELVTDDEPPAFAAALRLASRIALVGGDAFAVRRGEPPVLTLELP